MGFHQGDRWSHEGGGRGGGRYQDFGGARFQEAVRDRSRGSASRGGGVAGGVGGGVRRVLSSGIDGGVGSDEEERELEEAREGSRLVGHRSGGGGDGDWHRRDGHTAEVWEMTIWRFFFAGEGGEGGVCFCSCTKKCKLRWIKKYIWA